MKRVISIMLSLTLLLSFSVTVTNASDGAAMIPNDPTGNLSDDVGVEQNIQLPISEDYAAPEAIDLPAKQVSTFSGGNGKTILDDTNPLYQELDFSKAIDITSEVFGKHASTDAAIDDVATMDLPENQPPVADPAFILMNPETMRDGKFTTATMLFIATRWNNTDLCYDPEGSPISLVCNSSFPAGYISELIVDPDGTFAGYLVNIFNKGTYPFAFVFADMYGGVSETFGDIFDVISRGVFETIDGSLSSVNDKKTYTITVDYSVADEYYIGLLRTGTGGFKVSALDSDGEVCGTTQCWGDINPQLVRSGISLKKPTGVSGEYSYTLEISTTSSKYVEGDVSFRIAYGEASQQYYFFEDASDSINLPYYHSVRDRYNQIEPDYYNDAVLSDYGNYFKFEATGTETVTLVSNRDQYRFKILDCTTFETLYNGKSLNAFKGPNVTDTYSVRVDINFVAGTTYYIVVYDLDCTEYSGGYNITIGEPVLRFNTSTHTLGATNCVQGQPYSWSFKLTTPNGRPAYVEKACYSATTATWPIEGGYFSVLAPGANAWRENTPKFYPEVNFNFTNPKTPLVRADGQWEFGITANKTGTFPQNKVSIHYWYEL